MNKFTQAYDAARKAIITEKKYESTWQTLLTSKIAPILEESGPSATHAAGLKNVQDVLDTKAKARTGGSSSEKVANTIYDASIDSSDTTGLPNRAAALKMMNHFHFAQKSGAQNVWVYAPPSEYTKWVFDEIAGTKAVVVDRLAKDTAVYTPTHRTVMCDALHQASKVVMDAIAKLGTPTDASKAVFQRWFGAASGTALTTNMTAMAATYKKISVVLKSTTMVFSDEPIDRQSAWQDWGFVYATKERFPVVYVQKAFLTAAGSSGQLWKCALTLVHELSHYAADTEDYRYDNGAGGDLVGTGLTPDATFTTAKAMNNADSLAYFCVDLAGFLSATDRTKALAGTI